MRRRNLLTQLGGVATAMSIAGCSGSDGSGGGTEESNGDPTETPTPTPEYEVDPEAPARLKILRVSFPSDLSYGQEFEGEVTFANVGGDPVEQNAKIELVRLTSGEAEPQVAKLNSEELGSGESKSHSIGPFEATAAGEFRVQPGSGVDELADEIDPLVSVGPRQVQPGTEVEMPNRLRVTVTGVSYEQALIDLSKMPANWDSDEEPRPELRPTLEDQIIAVFNLSVSNAGTEGLKISREQFVVPDGQLVQVQGDPALENKQLIGQQVNPGTSVSGWVGYVVSKQKTSDLSLGLNTAATSTPADIEIPVAAPEGFPKFELVDQVNPSELKNEETQEFKYTIKNTGDATGTFRGTFQFLLPDPGLLSIYEEDTWYSFRGTGGAKTAEIPSGDSRTVKATFSTGYDRVHYRLQPFNNVVKLKDEDA